MDPIVRDQLLARFASYLDGVDETEAADPDAGRSDL